MSRCGKKSASVLSLVFPTVLSLFVFLILRAVRQRLLANLELTKRVVVPKDLWYFLHPLGVVLGGIAL